MYIYKIYTSCTYNHNYPEIYYEVERYGVEWYSR